ncbi:MAG: TonB-dependent receptor [Bacteroidia bacterium]|nr:TonB-dependent receptor [Bacteroidia bacterium]
MLFSLTVYSQEYAIIAGSITDSVGKPIDYVNVTILNQAHGTNSDKNGYYEFKIPANKNITIVYSCVGYKSFNKVIKAAPGQKIEVNIPMTIDIKAFRPVDVEDYRENAPTLQRLDPKLATIIPTMSDPIEAMLKTTWAHSTNELSSQYSVRGGNFDENLVYVNDIEVYRPFLVRSGQQEGMSFINSDMVSSILFSAGGFDAKYGDKMSSVLDIKYKRPVSFASSVTLSLLGASAHVEGVSKDKRFSHISGIRYKTTQYVLNTLDVKGDYNPSFIDFQTFWTYVITDKLDINFLGNYAQNKYEFVPVNRETIFGTINEALKFKIYFDGQEMDKFIAYTGAVSANYRPREKLTLKLITSVYQTSEEETFDIQGQYYLNELDKQMGSSTMGDSLMNIGVGTYLNHARNYLNATVYNISHIGYFSKPKNKVQWGLSAQHEIFKNKIHEWQMLDSAGYSVPYTDSIITLATLDTAAIYLSTNRFTSYIQNTRIFLIDNSEVILTFGLRGNYWDFNNHVLISPRASLSFNPKWKKDIVFRLAGGFYYQPPFFKEIRDLTGNINRDIKAQQSVHIVLGSDYNFKAWSRPFKFVTEIYYKYLNDLIPYNVDNVRIRYFGKNMAHGYAAGIDMKLNGEFVPGVDSWASMSVMQTQEDVDDDGHGYIPRPADQLVNFGLFFQDYLPKNPSYKVSLSLLFGTGLPFGPPNSERWEAYHRMRPYRRVDIGFSKVIKSEDKVLSASNPFRFFKSVWLTAEIFNLLDINNTISYQWVSDIRGRQYAIPNYLTSRRINLKLIAKF